MAAPRHPPHASSDLAFDDLLPLTPLQEGLLYLNEDPVNATAYVVQSVVYISHLANTSQLRYAASLLFTRHPSLRASFRLSNLTRPVQIIHAHVPLEWLEDDLSASTDIERAFEHMLAADQAKGFALDEPPLVRFRLVHIGAASCRLVVTHHHIIMDGWSLGIIVSDLARSVTQPLAADDPDALRATANAHYREYFAWRSNRDTLGAMSAWREALAHSEPSRVRDVVMLDPNLDAGEAGHPAIVRIALSEDVSRQLAQVARSSSVTVASVATTLFGVALGRLLRQQDVVFGTVVAQRPADLAASAYMAGLFINTVPVRIRWTFADSPRALAERSYQDTLALMDHNHLGLADIQRAQGERGLFDALFIFENQPSAPPPATADLVVASIASRDAAHYPLHVFVRMDGRHLTVEIGFWPAVISGHTAREFGERYVRLLEAAAFNPDETFAATDHAVVPDISTALAVGVGPERTGPQRTLCELLHARVRATPDALAVVSGSRQWTYAELDADATELAHRLREAGAKPERRVAILLSRSYEYYVALAATAKSGAAFVPIDPLLPVARIRLLVEDAQPLVVVATDDYLPLLGEGRPTIVSPWAPPSRSGQPSTPAADLLPCNLCYVIYTSGSTGRPKGVAVTHAGLAALAEAQLESVGSRSRMLQFASTSVDPSVEDLVVAWASGAALILLDEPLAGADLVAFLERHAVDHADLPLTVLRSLPPALLPSLRNLVAVGDVCSPELVRRWAQGRTMVTGYGVTEATVTSTYSDPLTPSRAIALGRPIRGSCIYILDSGLAPMPRGVVGEIYVGGEGLARGYLDRPALTAERFVANPFAGGGERIFRTGDLGWWDDEGDLHFLSRTDDQVKIRGMRVELGEIEAALNDLPYVREAAAALLRSGEDDQILVGYVVVADDVAPTLPDYRARLARCLPSQMVPSSIVVLDELPKTLGGKVDRARLPSPRPFVARQQPEIPHAGVEQELCELFADVLGVAAVGIEDSLFDLGGQSLVAMRLLSRLKSTVAPALTLAALLRAPTVAGVMAHMEAEPDADRGVAGE